MITHLVEGLEHEGGYWLFEAARRGLYDLLANAFPDTTQYNVPQFDAIPDGTVVVLRLGRTGVEATLVTANESLATEVTDAVDRALKES